jgi:hypothetical protein
VEGAAVAVKDEAGLKPLLFQELCGEEDSPFDQPHSLAEDFPWTFDSVIYIFFNCPFRPRRPLSIGLGAWIQAEKSIAIGSPFHPISNFNDSYYFMRFILKKINSLPASPKHPKAGELSDQGPIYVPDRTT